MCGYTVGLIFDCLTVYDPLFAPGIEKGVDKDVIKGAGLLGAGLGLVTGGLAGAAILGTFGAYAAIAPGKVSFSSKQLCKI